MNKVIIIGRLTKEPDVRYSQNNQCVARYSIAVNRKTKNENGQYDADFINCIAFGKMGEFAEKYLHKGMKIAITGHIQTGSYTNKEGQRVYTTDVAVDEHEFVESKAAQGNTNNQYSQASNVGDGFMSIPDINSDSLPFN